MLAYLKDKKFLHATAVLVGIMVGVGIFGIPFAFAKSGFLLGLGFLILAFFITLFIDLIYGEIVLRTESKHQLPGYGRIYLGKKAQKIILFIDVFSIYGALLAYTIASGFFLFNIFSSFLTHGIQPEIFSLIFFSVCSILVLGGVKTISTVELIISGVFLLVIVGLFITGGSSISLDNFKTINPEGWFLPYGVLLFAFAGFSGIPIQRRILKGEESKLFPSILTALIFTALIYLAFVIIILGVYGDATPPNALTDIDDLLGTKIVLLGSIFGIASVTTSFLALSSALKEVFQLDQKVRARVAWFLTIFPPLILFVVGLRKFIDVVSLTGAVAIGLLSIMIIFMYMKAKRNGGRIPEYSLMFPRWLLYLVMLLSLAGIVYALVFNG